MRYGALVLASALYLNSCTSEETTEVPPGPVEWSASASTSATEVQVGDDFEVVVTLTHPPGGDFVAPSQADFEPFDVIETWTEEVSPIETRLHYRLAAYRLPEMLEVPALSVDYRDGTGEIQSLATEAIPVQVVTSLTPDVTDIHDIKNPMALEIPRDWRLLLWLLLALLAALAAYIMYRKLRKEPEEPAARAWVPPPPPPHIEAEEALARLERKGLVEKGQIALFYTELSDIVKRYAGRRFDVPYLERTTGEITRDLAAVEVSHQPVRAILETADLVKFAKLLPQPEDARSSLAMAKDFVRETKPVPLEATA